MEPRRDEQNPDRKIREEIPQEPIAADPIEEDEAKDGPEEDDSEDEDIGQPVELDDEPLAVTTPVPSALPPPDNARPRYPRWIGRG